MIRSAASVEGHIVSIREEISRSGPVISSARIAAAGSGDFTRGRYRSYMVTSRAMTLFIST